MILGVSVVFVREVSYSLRVLFCFRRSFFFVIDGWVIFVVSVLDGRVGVGFIFRNGELVVRARCSFLFVVGCGCRVDGRGFRLFRGIAA